MEFATGIPDTVPDFWISFNEQVAAIGASLDDPDVPIEKLSSIRSKITELQVYSTNAASMLPKYDVRRSQEEIDILKKKCGEVEKSKQPRKKFAFSSRSKSSSKTSEGDKKPNSSSDNVSTAPRDMSSVLDVAGSIIVEHKNGETIDVNSLQKEGEIAQIQLLMRNSSNCEVVLMGHLGSARFEHLTGCRVYLGPCFTSVYLESCVDCTFFIWCHQLRIHKTLRTDMYVYVNSHPIIEDCEHMRFAPYCARYASLEADVKAAGLENSKNWDNVVDFLWHRSTHSPNWTTIPANAARPSIPHPGWSVTEITSLVPSGTAVSSSNSVDGSGVDGSGVDRLQLQDKKSGEVATIVSATTTTSVDAEDDEEM